MAAHVIWKWMKYYCTLLLNLKPPYSNFISVCTSGGSAMGVAAGGLKLMHHLV
jgi:hypothetical protein